MKTRLLLFLLLACIAAYAHAHILYQGKAFTFTNGPPGSTKVDVIIEQDNSLSVFVNGAFWGSRANFCERAE